MTQVAVGDNVTNVDFSAIFDSGTSFTYVDDPAYSVITQNVSHILTPRLIIIIGMHSTLTRLVDFFSSLILKCNSHAINPILVFLLNTATI